MATPEGKVKAMVSRKLKELHAKWPLYKFMPVQNGLGASTLDYLLCVRGRFVAIETKKPGGKMTPRQEAVTKEIVNAGGVVYVITNEEEMDKLIADLILMIKFSEHVEARSPD